MLVNAEATMELQKRRDGVLTLLNLAGQIFKRKAFHNDPVPVCFSGWLIIYPPQGGALTAYVWMSKSRIEQGPTSKS